MLGIEIIGYVASVCIVLSLTMRSMRPLRVIGLVGAVAFVIYGVALAAWPVVVTNGVAAGVQFFHLRALQRQGSNDGRIGTDLTPPSPKPLQASILQGVDPAWPPPVPEARG